MGPLFSDGANFFLQAAASASDSLGDLKLQSEGRLNIGALTIRIGFPLKGSFKGYSRGYYDIGAIIVRIGFLGIVYYN